MVEIAQIIMAVGQEAVKVILPLPRLASSAKCSYCKRTNAFAIDYHQLETSFFNFIFLCLESLIIISSIGGAKRSFAMSLQEKLSKIRSPKLQNQHQVRRQKTKKVHFCNYFSVSGTS